MDRVLFVDDEMKVLDGLRRMLRGYRKEWDMAFADGADAALTLFADKPFDVVVSDMRMPLRDGARLLQEIRRNYPDSVRIILSGQCDRSTVMRTVGVAHQFLTKPCDSESLKMTVTRACNLRDRLADNHYKQLISRISCVPSYPHHYAALMAALADEKDNPAEVYRILSEDVGATMKIMQLVSTSFFGTPQRLSHPLRAASLFDLDTLRALAARDDIFQPFQGDSLPSSFIEWFEEHSRNVAQLAFEIAKRATSNQQLADDAYLAGMLHDIGILLLAQHTPERYEELFRKSGEKQSIIHFEEVNYQQATHSNVGGYLTALWGLADPIVEAIGFHHHPGQSIGDDFSPLTAVHVADALINDHFTYQIARDRPLDRDYLRRIRNVNMEEILGDFQAVGEPT